jgi:arylsulfatase A-like enzyme
MSEQTKPDIMLIVLDTLRADRLSCYGYPRETSPHSDAFAGSSTLFERAISPAQWTIPAHASLFTGEYPTTHRMTQINDKHSTDQITLAQVLHDAGYCTVGFCNNPLLGVVENGLERGFEAFRNYCGILPDRSAIDACRLRGLGWVAQRTARIFGSLVTPLQDLFARSNLAQRIALSPWVIPLWHRVFNFKGNTARSMQDLVGYLHARRRRGVERPLYAFVNLMETHLPFEPSPDHIRKFVPYYWQDRKAREFMQSYNSEYYRWMVPLTEPLTELQGRVINDMYDAEVAYVDSMLRPLFDYLEEPKVRQDMVVIITSDHGEGLNHHNFVGHSLVAYDDLVHVPLIVRYPRLYPEGKRVATPVSTRRIFHSVLESAGIHPVSNSTGEVGGAPVDVQRRSLARVLDGSDPEAGIAFTEAYTPKTLIALMEHTDRRAIETYRCRLSRQAVCRGDHKLIAVGGEPDELFDVVDDPGELKDLITEKPELALELNKLLKELVAKAETRRVANRKATRLRLEENLVIAERLRRLGYIG